MRRRFASFVLLFACACASASAAPAIAELGWLAGHWSSERDGRWTEELWTDPRGGVLLGVNRSGVGDVASAYEFMRIAADADGEVAYWASPAGAAPTRFALVEASATHAVFENPAHDYPVRIEYRRDGEVLMATISGPDGGDPRSWRFERRQAGVGQRP